MKADTKTRYKHKPDRPGEWDLLHFMFVGMQFSDNTKQKQADAAKLLDRARERGVVGLAGTEAGAGQALDLRRALQHESADHGFRHYQHPGSDSWVTINEDFIDGGWDTWHSGILVPARARRNTAKRLIGATWNNKRYGKMTSSACHYMTKGRPDAKSPEYREFLDDNRKIAEEIGRQSKLRGAGSAKFWYSGDQNIVDRFNDTFLGRAKMTSAADEVGNHPNTGHGNIDVIASYDEDGGVVAEYFRALTDKEFHLHTDHFLTEAGFWVRRVKAA